MRSTRNTTPRSPRGGEDAVTSVREAEEVYDLNREDDIPTSTRAWQSEATEWELAESLRYINPFAAKRHADMHQPVFMREVMSTGEASSLQLSLRKLQARVNRIAKVLDSDDRAMVPSVRESFTFPADLSPLPKKGKGLSRPMSVEQMEDGDQSGVINLRIRDLRRLDFSINPSEEPSFWVRKHAVLVSIDPIRAVIMASRIIIIVPPGGMDRILEILERHLADCSSEARAATAAGGGPGGLTKGTTATSNPSLAEGADDEVAYADHHFEITAIEAILATVSTLHSQQFRAINEEAKDALLYFDTTSTISVLLPFAVQEKIRNVKNELSALRSRLASLEKSLQSLIDEPENVAFMNLTLLGKKPDLYQLPLKPELGPCQEEMEELLEAYLVDCNNQETLISNLLLRIENAEQLMAMKLDTARNQILVVNMSLQTTSVLIGFGAYVTGVFGMNLDNTVLIQPIYGLFEIVTVTLTVLIIVGNIAIMYYYERTGVVPATIRFHNRVVDRIKNVGGFFSAPLAPVTK